MYLSSVSKVTNGNMSGYWGHKIFNVYGLQKNVEGNFIIDSYKQEHNLQIIEYRNEWMKNIRQQI